METSPDDLLTSSEVALMLDASTETVRRWAKQGRLRYVALPSGRRRYRRCDVEAILEPVEPTEAAS